MTRASDANFKRTSENSQHSRGRNLGATVAERGTSADNALGGQDEDDCASVPARNLHERRRGAYASRRTPRCRSGFRESPQESVTGTPAYPERQRCTPYQPGAAPQGSAEKNTRAESPIHPAPSLRNGRGFKITLSGVPVPSADRGFPQNSVVTLYAARLHARHMQPAQKGVTI